MYFITLLSKGKRKGSAVGVKSM